MESIGAEVGQKMRSAIKAKLMELDCYVDDELPDYIMVMVANRRTKSQMNEDLNLFLSTKTSTFVNWLHIVLKKLKEVTVTNPEVYKKAVKRKPAEVPPDDKSILKVKHEKVNKKLKKESKEDRKCEQEIEEESGEGQSMIDHLPITRNKLADNRKIVVDDNKTNLSNEDNFDIPLLSEVSDTANERDLQELEKKIRNVKSRLGLLVESDDENFLNIKSEKDKDIENETNTLSNDRQISILNNEIADSQNRDVEFENHHDGTPPPIGNSEKKPQHERITFNNERESVPVKSRLDRRRSRSSSRNRFRNRSRERSPMRGSSGKKNSILNRLGQRLGTPDRANRLDNRQRDGYREGGDFRKRSSSRERDRSNRFSSRLGRDRRQMENSREKNRSTSKDRSPLSSRDRDRREESKKQAILSRLGVQSKITVIKKSTSTSQKSDDEEEKIVREVQSLIKVKPRTLPSVAGQANKNLLLKAVADAQRSIAQTPKVGKEIEIEGVFTSKYSNRQSEHLEQKKITTKRLAERPTKKLADPGKGKVKDIIRQSSSRMRSRLQLSSDEYDSDGEYIPKPVRKAERDVPKYIPSKSSSETESKENDTKINASKQQFIITLDGIDKLKLDFLESSATAKARLSDISAKKRTPSPIVFDKITKASSEIKPSRADIPETLPIIHPPLAIKNKERCRYWPNCRQGDKCEFVHPSESCQMFPLCKLGEKCIFLHPKCKFGSSCTKRDCPFSHSLSSSLKSPVVPAIPNCKYFPNCANAQCPFYHPKPCKYGKYCKNIMDCTFSHAFVASKKNMTWKSK